MNSSDFDKVRFVLSTEALSRRVLPQVLEPQLAEIRRLARLEIEEFMAGGDNYYLDVDFSIERQARTQKHYLEAIRKTIGDPAIECAIDSLVSGNSAASQGYQNARARLESIASRFCWLKAEDLVVQIDQTLEDLATKLVSHNLDPQSVNDSENDELLGSTEPLSAWDERILGDAMFDGIEGVVALSARGMLEGRSSLGFLRKWRLFLNPGEFASVCNFLWKEAQAELINGDDSELRAIDELVYGPANNRHK